MGLSLSSTDLATRFSFHLLRLSMGRLSTAGADRHHESGGAGPATDRCTDKTIGGEPAIGVATIAPQPCIRCGMIEKSWLLEHPNHDAAMRIGGEAPRRRAHSLPRHGSHGLGRVTATSDRLGVASRRAG